MIILHLVSDEDEKSVNLGKTEFSPITLNRIKNTNVFAIISDWEYSVS